MKNLSSVACVILLITTACQKPDLSPPIKQYSQIKQLTCADKDDKALTDDQIKIVNADCLRVGIEKNPFKPSNAQKQPKMTKTLWQF